MNRISTAPAPLVTAPVSILVHHTNKLFSVVHIKLMAGPVHCYHIFGNHCAKINYRQESTEHQRASQAAIHFRVPIQLRQRLSDHNVASHAFHVYCNLFVQGNGIKTGR